MVIVTGQYTQEIRPSSRTMNRENWRAVCAKRRTHGSEGDGWKRASNGTSPAVYPTVVGDLSQRQMVMKEQTERNKHLNRAVYNDWGLYSFTQMLRYKCALYGKDLIFLDERNTSKTCSGCGTMKAMPLWKRTYACTECGLVMDRDENSAINILTRYFARLGPHTGDPLQCADVFTAIDDVGIRDHI